MAAMNDRERLIQAMKEFGSGKFDRIDTESFEDKELAEAFNAMRDEVIDRNNYFLIRINETLKIAGESSWLNEMFDIIETQTLYLKDIQDFYDTVEKNVVNTDTANANILAGIRTIKSNIEPCIDGIEEILGILDALKNGDAFLDGEIDKVIRLMEFNRRTFNNMEFLVNDTLDQIVNIYEALVAQNEVTKPIINNVRDLADTCNRLSMQCFNAGKRTHEITRNADLVRNHMFRKNSALGIHDCLRIYAVDHIVLTARLYNHVAEYETLDISQLNNPEKCKLGVWLNESSPEWIRESDEFKRIAGFHEELHRHAVNVFNANEGSDRKLAMEEYGLARRSLSQLLGAFNDMHHLLISEGILEDDVKGRVEEKILGDRR